MSDAAPNFDDDIAPILFKYRGQMAWRLDLANYADVQANANVISAQITPDPPGMPPPPFPPFPQSFIDMFNTWIENGCPEKAASGPSTSGG